MAEQSMAAGAHEEGAHASPNYVGVFIALAVLTLVEVGVSLLSFLRAPLLLALMATKAALVAMYYMHLKFESRWYTIIFLIPLPFVALVVIALLVGL